MKKNKKVHKIENEKIFIGLVIIIFVMILIPIARKASYSLDGVDEIVLSCPEQAKIGEDIECAVILNAESINVHGVSGKISHGKELSFDKFIYTQDSSWDKYVDVNYVDFDGFVLASDGVSGTNVIGKLRYKVLDSISENSSNCEIKISDLVITDGDKIEKELSDVVTSIKIIREETSDLSDINTLDDLVLTNGFIDETFDKNKNNYNAIAKTENIVVNYIKTDEKSSVTGDIGLITLEAGNNELNITVTSESGKTNVYTINIYLEVIEYYQLSFDTDLDVVQDKKFIVNIVDDTKVSDILGKINVIGASVHIYDKDGNVKDNDKILFSGDKLITHSGSDIKDEYIISILGDSSGDGIIDLIDLVQMRKHIVKLSVKDGVYQHALDLNKDGIIDLIDLVKMRKRIVGIK